MFRTHTVQVSARQVYMTSMPLKVKLIRVLATMTLCYVPNGKAISPEYQTECNTQFYRTQGVQKDLQPEESTSITAGFSRTDQKFSVLC
jgi:hypothetical protein